MRNKLYQWLSIWIWNHPRLTLSMSAMLTIVMLLLASQLAIKTQFSDMIPKDIPIVQEFEGIIDNFLAANTVMIIVEDSTHNKEKMKAVAKQLAESLKVIPEVRIKKGQDLSIDQKIKTLSSPSIPVEGVLYDTVNLVKRLDWKIDRDFISIHGMMMQKTKDLKNFSQMFNANNLPDFLSKVNDNFEKEYVDDQENLSSLDGEAQAIQGIDGFYRFIQNLDQVSQGNKVDPKKTADHLVLGEEYFFSPDNSILMMMLQPSVSANEWESMMYLGLKVMEKTDAIQEKYPELYINATGLAVLGTQENEAIKNDFGLSSLIALGLIFIILVGSFSSWKSPFFSIIVLVISLIWVAGTLAVTLEYLNMMSASFGIILIGLGIDFSIHMIGGYRDSLDQGLNPKKAILNMYQKVGNGVVTGAATTAIVFFSMLFAGAPCLD